MTPTPHKPTAQERIELNFDRELNHQKEFRAVELLIRVVIVGMASVIFLFFIQPVVKQAQLITLQSNLRLIRVSVQTAMLSCYDKMEQNEDGSLSYHLALTPDQDDENGAVLRSALTGYLPTDSGMTLNSDFSGLLEDFEVASQSDSAPTYRFTVTQQDGVFTIQLWQNDRSLRRSPQNPDCNWISSGDPYIDLSGNQGEFIR